MNPFDWRGPQFLGLYVILSGAGIVLMYLVSRGLFSDAPRTPSGVGRKRLRDPYLLAYLRGGVVEALKTVMFSLNRRKLMTATRDFVTATRSRESLQAVRNPLELSVIAHCAEPREGLKIVRDGTLKRAVENYVEPLRESGLVADDREFRRRLPVFLAIGGGLLAIGAIKIQLALQRGHTNIAFLVVLAVLAFFAVLAAYRRRRTPAGDRALADQQTLLGRLRDRARRLAADGSTDEAVLVAAAFGFSELSPESHPFIADLKRQLTKNTDTSSGCGSGCGGGGCGGGCGGCGS